MGESHAAQKQKFLPIIRSDNGRFFGFGEDKAPPIDNMSGRFAHFLPPKVPNAGARELAKAMLKAEGPDPAKRGAAPRLPRSRR